MHENKSDCGEHMSSLQCPRHWQSAMNTINNNEYNKQQSLPHRAHITVLGDWNKKKKKVT